MDDIKELFADIRNKLQPCKTALEVVNPKITPPIHLIKIALDNIEQIELSLSTYENKIKKGKA